MIRSLAIVAAAVAFAGPVAAQSLSTNDAAAVTLCRTATYGVDHLCDTALARLGDRASPELRAELQARADANRRRPPGILEDLLSNPGTSSTTSVRINGERYTVRTWVSQDGRRSSVRVD